ncbi:sigma-70 family RNA polymerase sigma factor [Streptomyces sp. NPDC001840]
MSGDGRDEPLGGGGADGGTEPGGTVPRQVPNQGGPKGAPGPDGPGSPAGTGGPGGRASGAPGVQGVPSVPEQSGPGGSGRPAGFPGGLMPHPSTGSPAGGGPADAESSVPQQRERGGVSSAAPAPPAVVDPSASEGPPSDADLIQRMRDGDDSAYEELFRRHSDAVRRYARTCCRDAHTADDLTAEVFARTLQAVRGGAGPEQAVRAYLLTTVRRVAASWTKSAKREQLVDDFAVFAAQAARSSEVSDTDTLDLGADVLAMREAEHSMAMQAFRSLPERWQAVLWHTAVEEESPSEVAPLFGLSANATAVLAHRAREGLKQAYLQAHVNTAHTSGGDCARYADRLGAYARGGLRMRAERGLRKHLEECAKCRLAAGELAHINDKIPAQVLPVAVIGWFAAGYSLKAAGIVAGGAAGAAGAGAAAAATGGGGAAASGSAAGAAGAASGGAAGAASGGAASGGAGGGAAGGAAASEGLGAPAKAGIAGLVAVAAAAGLVYALVNDSAPQRPPKPKPPVAQPVVPPKPVPSPPSPEPPAPEPSPPPKKPTPSPAPKSTPSPKRSASPSPKTPPKPKPTPPPTPAKPRPPVPPVPPPVPSPTPSPTPPPPPPPADYRLNRLSYDLLGDGTEPEVRLLGSSWLWQRSRMTMDGTRYGDGVTVQASSSVTIDLNRSCVTYAAMVGVDDLTHGFGAVRFSLYGDGGRLWRSPVLRGGDEAVPMQVGIAGQKTIRLVVEPHRPFDRVALADWAQSRISCR